MDVRKMAKEKYRSVIQFLFLVGKSRGDSFSMTTSKSWFNEFLRGHTPATRPFKVREIAEIVVVVLVDHVSARWMPHLLIPDYECNIQTTSQQRLRLFKRFPKEFLSLFISVDKIWMYKYTPEAN